MNGKLKDEPEAGMEHNELMLAMKNKTNKLEKLWIRIKDELGLFQPKGDQISHIRIHYLL